MPSCMPRPLTQPTFMQAQFEELARQHQDIEALELEVKRMSRTLNRNAVRNARVRSATSVRGSKRTCGSPYSQSQAQSDTGDPEPPHVGDISSEGEFFYSDQEDNSGTPVLDELLMGREELEDCDSLSSPVVNKAKLWKFAEQTPSSS